MSIGVIVMVKARGRRRQQVVNKAIDTTLCILVGGDFGNKSSAVPLVPGTRRRLPQTKQRSNHDSVSYALNKVLNNFVRVPVAT